MPSVVEIQGLSFSYGREDVLSAVDLTVEPGDFVALLGPNGGGKTTLLKILAGILKPRRGRVRVLGQSPRHSRGRIGYVPQNVNTSPAFPVTVQEAVMMGGLTRGSLGWRWPAGSKEHASRALAEVGMTDMAGRLLAGLSGGERQRVFIARALVSQPELLLLDEPVSGVDRRWRESMFDLLHRLSPAVTILMVSHDVNVISQHVKSVACVNREVFYHPTPQITAEMLERTYQCPVELVAHGVPHRVLADHDHREHGHD